MMKKDPDWQADLARYPKHPFIREQSIWAIWVYRFGRRIDSKHESLKKKLMTKLYWFLFRLVETGTGISLPKAAKIGPGLRIWHFGNIVIHPESVIGANCTIRQGVTIGNRIQDGKVPIIGDDVDIGAYAQILGPIRIGNSCKIGAMTVVLCDLPDEATIVGPASRVVVAGTTV